MEENKDVSGNVNPPAPDPAASAPVAPAASEAAAPAAPEAAAPAASEPVVPAAGAPSVPVPVAPAASATSPMPATAPENPFAAVAPAQPTAPLPASDVTAPVASGTVVPAPSAAPAPVQPYAVGAAPSQSAPGSTVSYGASWDAAAAAVPPQQPQQPAGAVPPSQPPVPPAPVYGYEPPAGEGQKRRWPWFLLGLAVGLVIGLGGCVSCAGIMAAASFDSGSASRTDGYDYYDYGYDDDYGYGYGYDDDYGYDHNHDYGYSYPPEDDYDLLDDGVSSGSYTYDEIASALGEAGLSAGTPNADGSCAMGFYTVGPQGDIPAGLYYLEGSNDEISHYYIFDGEGNGTGMRYDLDDAVQYLGNYFAELDDGDLIAFVPGGDLSMRPAPATSINPAQPYTNGCYRVGVDIPAGSYTITALPLPEADATAESAAFVMKDLDFDDDSIVDTQYVIAGGKQVVTVSDGQYLELFGAQATPVAQG